MAEVLRAVASRKVPAKRRVRHFFRLGDGNAIAIDHLWTLRRRWRQREESVDPSWVVWPIGPFVVAFHIEV